ncbi:hypothetical protein GCM10010172_43260 [Paractinoplanes ferrugineus]|uniref:Uncharacterized protein n=1 Tax=Paractinoplanes ferrugineus TaxID=113564 RepID=A0A919J4G7_9ACTN|nr:hypothetical protein [Actinoplanes ferrugineus]GIE13484.1 hypothetical protein Afe05nite_53240 [Actinoplanes ferrugineus]
MQTCVQLADGLGTRGVEVSSSAPTDEVLDADDEEAKPGDKGEQDHDSPPNGGEDVPGRALHRQDDKGDRTNIAMTSPVVK